MNYERLLGKLNACLLAIMHHPNVKFQADMVKFLSSKIDAFGLDISDLSLKIAKLEKTSEGLSLASFSEEAIPAGVIEDSKVAQEKLLSDLIRKAVKGAVGKKIKTYHVIASLPEEKSFLDVFQMPFLTGEELASAVRFEAANHIPMGLEDVYLDFEPIPPIDGKTKHLDVLVVATSKEIADSYLRALNLAGLRPLALEVECLAIVRALIKKGILHKPLLIIDLGENRTNFMIFSGKSLRFTSTIPVSSRVLTEAIVQKMKISLQGAEKIKREEGLTGKKLALSAMIPCLNDLAEQVKNHLRYYFSHLPREQIEQNGKPLEKILLCGGGANLKGLNEFLSATLQIEVELGNPWTNILKEPIREVPALPFERSLGYTTALGLALRGIYGD